MLTDEHRVARSVRMMRTVQSVHPTLFAQGVGMRQVLLAPICAALLGASAVAAHDDSYELTDWQMSAAMPNPVIAPVPAALLAGHGACDGAHCGNAVSGCVATTLPPLPYHPPVLPPPTSLHGYFNSPPEQLHVWDSYPREVALRQWHRIAKEQHLKGVRQHRVGRGHSSGSACQ